MCFFQSLCVDQWAAFALTQWQFRRHRQRRQFGDNRHLSFSSSSSTSSWLCHHLTQCFHSARQATTKCCCCRCKSLARFNLRLAQTVTLTNTHTHRHNGNTTQAPTLKRANCADWKRANCWSERTNERIKANELNELLCCQSTTQATMLQCCCCCCCCCSWRVANNSASPFYFPSRDNSTILAHTQLVSKSCSNPRCVCVFSTFSSSRLFLSKTWTLDNNSNMCLVVVVASVADWCMTRASAEP